MHGWNNPIKYRFSDNLEMIKQVGQIIRIDLILAFCASSLAVFAWGNPTIVGQNITYVYAWTRTLSGKIQLNLFWTSLSLVQSLTKLNYLVQCLKKSIFLTHEYEFQSSICFSCFLRIVLPSQKLWCNSISNLLSIVYSYVSKAKGK